MTARTTPAGGTQALSWNAAGQLAQVSGGTGGTTTYIYAPDGSLLLQENPGSSTLYLDGEQHTATTSGGTTIVTGARIIPLPSGGDVVRTGPGTSYSFEVPDPHGTSDLYLDSTAQAPTWRQFTPYGAPRGTATTWIDNRGFLNKPADPATGLTYVGARAYDPVPRPHHHLRPQPRRQPITPARCGSRTPSSTTPGHDKHTSPCDMTPRTPGRTAGLDNRWTTRSPSATQSNPAVTIQACSGWAGGVALVAAWQREQLQDAGGGVSSAAWLTRRARTGPG
jgi:hypothetical protein